MRRIVYIFLLLIVSVPTKLTAQKLDIRDHYKYWYYRQRLMDEFIVIGEAEELGVPSGLSIPALAADHWGTNDFLTLSWKDNPIQGLGRYIGVLATELALLYQNGEPYEQTQWELYSAMKAYERLDYNCEKLYYPENTSGSLNGLFCRDDVPDYFTSNLYTSFRLDNNYSEVVKSNLSEYNSDYKISNPSGALEKTFYPSSEEWEGMLTGFALLVKSLANCPEGVVVYNNYRFIEEAILHTQRYMDYYKANNWVGKTTNDSVYAYGYSDKLYMGLYGQARAADFICDPDRQYTVPLSIVPDRDYSSQFDNTVNPLTDTYVYMAFEVCGVILLGVEFWNFVLDIASNELELINSLLSPNAQDYLNPYNVIGILQQHKDDRSYLEILEDYLELRLINYQKFCWNMFGNPGSHLPGFDSVGYVINNILRDEMTLVFRYDSINLLGNTIPGDTLKEKGTRWGASTGYTYAAIGDSWMHYDGILFPEAENVTFESLCTYSEPIGWTIFPLLNLYLNPKNKDADLVRKQLIAQLQTAPCDGPHYLPEFEPAGLSEGVAGWRNNYRWDASRDQMNGTVETDSNDPNGAKFPGLDYMLAYNLLWLEASQNALFSDYFDMTEHYDNLLDPEINSIESEDEVVYFDFTHKPDAEITLDGSPRSGYNYKQYDVKIITDHITLTGNQAYGDGYTLEILPDTTVTYCDIEEYLVP
ncbi:MAG: hypothetical protein JW801_04190 [Bacteroidales bacterium]|nr:hypothetical protein [Bacteroidales bacterium]